MKSENAIEVNGVNKRFRIFIDRGRTIKERVLFRSRRKYEYRQVLKGISFEVKKGEAVGLIGHNGCGKSTTLKLLTRILYPDAGTVKICGRVSSLIELGAGFHPDLSGRENIYINAAIFGLKKEEISRRLADIIAFSELEDFIDNPVRTYSSGMYMRLAFSVAINVDAEVLLIDEILAVGDANFQAKCFNKLREIKAKGTTIVIVSHALSQIEQICDRSIWIHDGQIRMDGTPREVHPVYLDYMGQKRQEIAEKEAVRRGQVSWNFSEGEETEAKNDKRWGNGYARIQSIRLLDRQGNEKKVFETGEDITVRMEYGIKREVKNAVFGIGIFNSEGLQCYGTNTHIDHLAEFQLREDGVMELFLRHVMLMPGNYTLDLAIESDMGIPVDYFREAETLEIYSKVSDAGVVKIEHEWILNIGDERSEKEFVT